jgi:hypothetical protein
MGSHTRPVSVIKLGTMDFLEKKGLSNEQISTLENTSDVSMVKKVLVEYFNLGELAVKDPIRCGIATDFYFYNYMFCKETGLSSNATAVFMKIMELTFVSDTNPPPSRTPTMENSFERFTEMVVRHSVPNPPDQIRVFERSYLEKLMNHAMTSYFRQFRLYQYVFCSKPRVVLEQVQGD